MGRHLASARSGIVRGAYSLEQHFIRRDAEGQTQGAIAIIRIDPIVARSQAHAGSHFDRFMSGSADLKIDAILPFQGDLAIVEAPGRLHSTEGADELVVLEATPLGDRVGG